MKVTAFSIVTKEGKEIGAGERGQKYIFWDKEDAQGFIKNYDLMMAKVGASKLGWIVTTIQYRI